MLALEISKTLGATGTLKALIPLQEIIDDGGKQFGKESVRAAELAVTFIQDEKTDRRTVRKT